MRTAASVQNCTMPSVSVARYQEVDTANNRADRDGQDTPPAGITHDGYMAIPDGMAKNHNELSSAVTMDDIRSGRSSPAAPTDATAQLALPGQDVTCYWGGASHKVIQNGMREPNAPASIQVITGEPPASVLQIPSVSAARGSGDPWIAQSAMAADLYLPPRSPWEEGTYSADTAPPVPGRT